MDGGGFVMSAVKPYRPASLRRKKVQRKSFPVEGIRRLTSFIIVMSFGLLALWGYFHASTFLLEVTQRFQIISAHLGFTLEDVIVEGRKRTNKTQILKTLNL